MTAASPPGLVPACVSLAIAQPPAGLLKFDDGGVTSLHSSASIFCRRRACVNPADVD